MNNQRDYSQLLILISTSFIVVTLFFSIFSSTLGLLELQASDLLFKLRYNLFGKLETYPYIVHVDVDDLSIKRIQYSIEDETLYKRTISILTEAYAEIIMLDMLFPKCADENCQSFVSEIKKSDRVYLPNILRPISDQKPQRYNSSNNHAGNLGAYNNWQPSISREGEPIIANISFSNDPIIDKNAKGIGFINCSPDKDGVYRRFPLLMKTSDGFKPALPLLVVCDYLKVPPNNIEIMFGKEIILHDAIFPDGRKKTIRIPINDIGQMIVNYAGPWHDSFPHYSIATLLDAEKDLDLLESLENEIEGNLVIVSDISTSSRDIGTIPLEEVYPLPGIHANIINSILKENFVSSISISSQFLLTILIIAIVLVGASRFRGASFLTFALVIIVFFICFVGFLFFSKGLVLKPVQTVSSLVLASVIIFLFQYFKEIREKALIQARFENYFAPELVKKVLKFPNMLSSCERKELTILFSDIVGFTSWCAKENEETVHCLLNEYFEEMTNIIFKYGGTVDKYIGDGLLVFFGDPIQQHDHCLRAVKASIEMQLKAKELKTKWIRDAGMSLAIRIGINCGEVIVGNLGSVKRLEYTVIGSHVNIAQRLESSAPPGSTFVSKAVYNALGGSITLNSAGKVSLKGYTHDFEVFEVVN